MCSELAQAELTFASETEVELLNHTAMKNTEYNPVDLASMISSESSFNALLEMMGDMGLELDSASRLG